MCCGNVIAVRLCGTDDKPTRFAFVEFEGRDGAMNAIGLTGTQLGAHPIRVSFAKSAIVKKGASGAVTPEVIERISRTIHAGNLPPTITEEHFKSLWGKYGEILQLSLAGLPEHHSRFGFVEFASLQSAQNAIQETGTIMIDDRPVRVSVAKAPIYSSPEAGQKREREDDAGGDEPHDSKRQRTDEEEAGDNPIPDEYTPHTEKSAE
eukprot:TRINITY_DN2204_c0_g1_i1.p1 TRINITY_DN2204_c0_g1~~TRINITY_DN2204_c0_g1_i1.p1  ORF type:complete len:207 (-),score=89.57 TRINITY_DN2204_c0_g1_i1:67-687(-)